MANPLSFFLSLSPEKRLSSFLWLVAAHSFIVGILLVIQPAALIKLMGFRDIHEPFFPCQGGVFHVIMAIAYIYGAMDIRKNKNLIIYAIIVKMAAAGFLFSYYYFMERLIIVFLSGAADFLMGLAIWRLLKKIKNDE
ncbi:MAG: hypothetical protein Q7U02_04625 [Desulfosalsimonadaceae bacterium]|nr:hypothetical protein [Desulfosalsimonadaceae bacterium]